MEEYNEKKLFETHSDDNPVARLHSRTIRGKGKKNHFDEKRGIPNVLSITCNALVEIRGKNIRPEWGLFNGSMGTVKDIVFHEGESPQTNLPAYVLVDFPLYCGPVFCAENPTFVPITTVEVECQFKCCQRTQIPLGLAFGKTAHTVQGANMGKERPGQPKNPFLSALVNLGHEGIEGLFTGITYTTISRGTTLGTSDDNLSSAIYFSGDCCPPSRFQNLNIRKDGKEYKNYCDRRKWLQYLESNKKTGTVAESEKTNIKRWFEMNPIPYYKLDTILTSC